MVTFTPYFKAISWVTQFPFLCPFVEGKRRLDIRHFKTSNKIRMLKPHLPNHIINEYMYSTVGPQYNEHFGWNVRYTEVHWVQLNFWLQCKCQQWGPAAFAVWNQNSCFCSVVCGMAKILQIAPFVIPSHGGRDKWVSSVILRSYCRYSSLIDGPMLLWNHTHYLSKTCLM